MSTFSSQLSLNECNFLRKSELIQVKRAKKGRGRKSELIQVKRAKKGRGRPQIIIVVKKDMSIKKVTKSITSNKIDWKKIIHMADPN